MTPTLARRAAAEGIGTGLLVVAVVGFGIMASRLSPDDVGLQLLENSLATGAALVTIILAFQPISAAFNPVVTLVERAVGAIGTGEAAVLILAQVMGGVVGVAVANVMYGLAPVTASRHVREGGNLWLGEVVATLGLVLVIFMLVRSGRSAHVAYAVGGYIAAAYWFTSSTSFANPAVTVARTLTDTFAGIAPASAPMFVIMQRLGAGLAIPIFRWLLPTDKETAHA